MEGGDDRTERHEKIRKYLRAKNKALSKACKATRKVASDVEYVVQEPPTSHTSMSEAPPFVAMAAASTPSTSGASAPRSTSSESASKRKVTDLVFCESAPDDDSDEDEKRRKFFSELLKDESRRIKARRVFDTLGTEIEKYEDSQIVREPPKTPTELETLNEDSKAEREPPKTIQILKAEDKFEREPPKTFPKSTRKLCLSELEEVLKKKEQRKLATDASNFPKSPPRSKITEEDEGRNAETPGSSTVNSPPNAESVQDSFGDPGPRSPSKQLTPPLAPVKVIEVPQPKLGSLYPNLEKAHCSFDIGEPPVPPSQPESHSPSQPESHSPSQPESHSRSQPESLSEPVPEMETPLLRSVAAYRLEQQSASTSVENTSHPRVQVESRVPAVQEDFDRRLAELKGKKAIYRNQMTQAQAALSLAINSVDHKNQIEEMEAQSTAQLIFMLIQKNEAEIVRLNLEKTVKPQIEQHFDRGTLFITSVKLQLDATKLKLHAFTYYAFALIHVGATLLERTPVVILNETFDEDDGSFTLSKRVMIPSVDSDFQAKVEVYAVRVPKPVETPSKKRKHQLYPLNVKEAPTIASDAPEYPFSAMGYVMFSVKKMSQKGFAFSQLGTNFLPWLPGKPLLMEFTFRGDKNLTFRAMVNYHNASLELYHCRLDGWTLDLFKYPSDEARTPVKSFSLSKFTSFATKAPAGITIIPYAFQFQVFNSLGERENHVLVAGSKVQQSEWISALNFYLVCNKDALTNIGVLSCFM